MVVFIEQKAIRTLQHVANTVRFEFVTVFSRKSVDICNNEGTDGIIVRGALSSTNGGFPV